MDAFQVGVLVVVAAAVLACCLAARAAAGRRPGEFGGRARARRSADAAQVARRDAEDLRQMLAATNERRRARGLPERTVADALREFGGD